MTVSKIVTASLLALSASCVYARPSRLDIYVLSGQQAPLSSLPGYASETLKEVKPQDWVDAFQSCTTNFEELAALTRDLTRENGVLLTSGLGPFPNISKLILEVDVKLKQALGSLPDSDPLGDHESKDATLVFDAFRANVKAASFWANLMTSKVSEFNSPTSRGYEPIGYVMATLLRVIQDNYQDLTPFVESYLPSVKSDVQRQAFLLTEAFTAAVFSYQKLSWGK